MALCSVSILLPLLITCTEGASHVVRRVTVPANGRASIEKSSQRADLFSSGELSMTARRDLLWQAVREVDDQFHQKSICKLEDGIAYAKEVVFLAGQASYSKTDVASARECALMCAADSLDDRNHKNLACKSFTFNKTARECKFFNFGQQARDIGNKNACCTSGPPCALDSMRKEIQSSFNAELERMMLSQKRLASQPKTASTRFVKTKAEHKVTTLAEHTAPKFERKVARPVPKHEVPNAEQKVAKRPGRAVSKAEQKVPKDEQKVAARAEHAVSKVEQKIGTQAAQSVPKLSSHREFEQRLVGPVPKHMVPKVERKIATQSGHLVPNLEPKLTTRAEHVVQKFEQKVVGPASKFPVPKKEQTATARAERAVPKVGQHVTTQKEHVVSKFEQSVAGPAPKHTELKAKQKVHLTQPRHHVPIFAPIVDVIEQHSSQKNVVPKAERKVTTQAEHAVAKSGQHVATQPAAQTNSIPTLSDHISPAQSTETHSGGRAAPSTIANLVRIHWRLLLVLFCVPTAVFVLARWFARKAAHAIW
jgi:uncharacterized protein (UPF0147 family)